VPIVVGVVALGLVIVLASLGPRRHGPALLLLAGVALGSLGFVAAVEGLIPGRPAFVSVAGLVAMGAGAVMLLSSMVWLMRRAGPRR
jgi:hypothetical protein